MIRRNRRRKLLRDSRVEARFLHLPRLAEEIRGPTLDSRRSDVPCFTSRARPGPPIAHSHTLCELLPEYFIPGKMRSAATRNCAAPATLPTTSTSCSRLSEEQVHSVPVSETEQPGVGKAIGGVVGAALGMAGGFELGVGITALVPGVGPVLAVGLAGMALLGAGGAVAGAALRIEGRSGHHRGTARRRDLLL